MKAPRRGFTAMEITVALGIIWIGAMVVSIVCRPARDIARNSSCSSNVKQIALAIQMYATDNNATMPPRYDAFASLAPYLKNTMIVRCPESKLPRGAMTDQYDSDYILRPSVQTDDLPGLVIVGDNEPGRHIGRHWIGARLDGAVFLWHANEWDAKLGWVMKDDTAKQR